MTNARVTIDALELSERCRSLAAEAEQRDVALYRVVGPMTRRSLDSRLAQALREASRELVDAVRRAVAAEAAERRAVALLADTTRTLQQLERPVVG